MAGDRLGATDGLSSPYRLENKKGRVTAAFSMKISAFNPRVAKPESGNALLLI
jgi:hypothetical protein